MTVKNAKKVSFECMASRESKGDSLTVFMCSSRVVVVVVTWVYDVKEE